MRKYTIPLLVLLTLCLGCERMLLGPEPENTARSNFEILWKTFDENYALFGPKRINWDSLHAVYGSRISESTSEMQLWDITTALLSHLDDGHVTIMNKDRSKIFNSSHLSSRPARDFSLDVVKSKYLVSYTTAGAGYLTYGKVKNQNIGYIYVASFASSSTGNGIDWAYDIDRIVQELYDCKAIIVDVRNNGGGLRVTGNVINSAFIDRDITYFYQRLKTGPRHDDFGDPRPINISPRPGVLRYNKHLALLTNRFSGSGAEYTAQVFKNLSYSTQIGDTTFGAFGELTMVSQLPNGWTYWYPCTLTTTPDGESPEGIGIIPDVLVQNIQPPVDSGSDRVLEIAIGYLSQY